MSVSRFGRHLGLALFCVALIACGDSSGGQPAANPERVDSQALRSQAEGLQARAFYQARNWAAAWDENNAEQLRVSIGQAQAHGLRPDMFLKALPDDPTERELALTKAALTYASALAPGLARALETGEVGPWLDSLAPRTDEYRALSQAFQQYRQRAAQVRDIEVAGGGLIKPGRTDPRIPAVAAALRANDYLPADYAAPASDTQRYTKALMQAVQHLQADRGLKPDGVIGLATLVALNRGPLDRARQLAVGLERLRWADRNPPARRIDVNTAATFLDYFRDGQHAERRRVVTGEPGWETPQLQSPIYRLVAHPIR